jgi:hypothetical protein
VEVLRVLRVLRRRRRALAVGLLLAIGLVVAGGHAKPGSSGVAFTRVALDTPKSQLVASAPEGASTLPWRASLLAHLVATDAEKQQIAGRLGIPVDQLAVADPTLAFPAVKASLPKGVAEVAAINTAPYVLSVSTPTGALPIISISAYGPDRTAAARLAAATASVLESEGSPSGRPGMQPFVIESIAPIHARTVVTASAPMKSIVLAVFVLGLWTAGVVLGPMLIGRLPRRRRRIEAT